MCVCAGLCPYTCGACNGYSITSVLRRCIKAYIYIYILFSVHIYVTFVINCSVRRFF